MSALINHLRRLFIYPVKYAKGDRFKMVIVVRSDLQMGKGKTAAQCAHAAIECFRQASDNKEYQEIIKLWLFQGQPKIVLQIRNEEALISLAREARDIGLTIAIIKDAGRTQLTPGTISTLAIGPAPIQAIDELTSKLRLL